MSLANNLLKESANHIFTFDDISDIKMTDIQKAEFRKAIADIRVEQTKQKISIFKLEYKTLLANQDAQRSRS